MLITPLNMAQTFGKKENEQPAQTTRNIPLKQFHTKTISNLLGWSPTRRDRPRNTIIVSTTAFQT